VLTCPSCGQETPEGFPRCAHCGAPLEAAPAAREQRKTVTVLFCDVIGSTALEESTDPEAVRARLARYFERMKGVVEAHGGTVEKFIGDAVMAVFGVPQVHEDDALRACRAAVEMRDALPEVGVQARIGINTGEVVTGTEERLATGDAVNVAARLEEAAAPEMILIGEATLALVREAVDTSALDPLELKGKAEPVPAYRLLHLRELPPRRHEAVFVGRTRELELLRAAWQGVVSERRCGLATIVGEPGVGKSRLVDEFLPPGARVVHGRCLPYGAGITYSPVVEVTKQLGDLPSDAAAASALRSLLGEIDRATSAEEIAWAFRGLLEEQARDRPLVVVFDDIHWGEETFLDLVEYVALLSSGAPILLLCMARPELVERRPEWPVSFRLQELSDAEVNGLLPEAISAQLRGKIARAAGGNPLFVTEMVAMAGDVEGEVAVPPTLQALLAARLDRLETAERRVLERGAVEGEVFHRGAAQALSDDGRVTPRLASLVRKELIRPDKSQLPAEDAFRFRHLLIRDAAYDALPKAIRAELHQRFASWFEERGRNVVELDEILGHHLERAARYKQELGQPDEELAQRAADRLAAAGKRALSRGDDRAAASLLERALEVPLELDLVTAIGSDPRRASAVAELAAEQAHAAGDELGEAVARVVAANHRQEVAADPGIDELEALALAALGPLERAADHAALVRVWHALGSGVANLRGRNEDWAHAAEQAIRHSLLAGQTHPGLYGLPQALLRGPRPADEALASLDEALPEPPHPSALLDRAWLLAMLKRFENAWALAHAAGHRLLELTGSERAQWCYGEIATLAGDHEAAAGYLRRWCDFLEAREQRTYLSTFAPRLGRSLCALGRYEEAEPLARLGRELGDEQDLATQVLWRQVHARVDAARGDHVEAERLAWEAVAIGDRTDWLNEQGNSLCDLADVLAAAARRGEALVALEQALERYERKKNLAMVAQVRPRLEALREKLPT
jgi:class 3 adenylate cyclase/tetratricopeptide (TPR) repeat protein